MWSDLSGANHYVAKGRTLIGNEDKIIGRLLEMNMGVVFNGVMVKGLSESVM